MFGPSTVGVVLDSDSDFLAFAGQMRGQLTATLMASETDLERHAALVGLLGRKVGWLLFNGYPTGDVGCGATQGH